MTELLENTQLNGMLQQALFEQVPYNIAVIDRDLNLVLANNHFREYFGDWRHKRCFQVYKSCENPCEPCHARKVFETGVAKVSDETGVDRNGRTCHYIVHTAPLKDENGVVQFILEMSRDITETKQFQREYDILFDRVPCYISVLDRQFNVIRANEKYRSTFGEPAGRTCYAIRKHRDTPCRNCPAMETFVDGREHVEEMHGYDVHGKDVYYVVHTSPLARSDQPFQHVIEIATDITYLKNLENQKLEAERLAAVGQTVAGLAHTIKNLLMGLEGGMYMVDSGLKKNNQERIERGWDSLRRNFDKTTQLVRGFLNFSKGRLPDLKPTDPNEIMRQLYELYKDTSHQQGVDLALDLDEEIAPAPLDPDGMEACLTNLISNGIDAAVMSDNEQGRVILRTREEDGALLFEVQDNGIGMDSEVKQKVFTTFFTTKGGKGTGLGLLTTRKIVQEHGGRISMDTEEGVGSTFRITLPRARLEMLYKQTTEKEE
ncbi:PAS domain-containing protein [bacterium]|nr:PAS domain-containing protein [bacterium]